MTPLTFIMSCLCSLATFCPITQAELYLPFLIMSCVSSLATFLPPTQAELYLPFLIMSCVSSLVSSRSPTQAELYLHFLSLLIVFLYDVIHQILCLPGDDHYCKLSKEPFLWLRVEKWKIFLWCLGGKRVWHDPGGVQGQMQDRPRGVQRLQGRLHHIQNVAVTSD